MVSELDGGWQMKAWAFLAVAAIVLAATSAEAATCGLFTGSTMAVQGQPQAQWRTDFPAAVTTPVSHGWSGISFEADPECYLAAVLAEVHPHFSSDGTRLVGTGSEPWWITPWMDYTRYGREPLMGLTKERSPDTGDLAPNGADDHQVWAIGFYNADRWA